MLSALLNTPKTQAELDTWSFHHRDSHNRIRGEIQQVYGVNLPEYILEPIAVNNISLFQEQNQEAHNDMNGVLQLQSSNLEEVNFSEENSFKAWIYSHWLEHSTAEIKLNI